ncbi:regulator of G-protein signaling 12b isoform X1 [Nerophis lumbriciformis]|uniref:regulator of G-protein signaling 12b isoform X1 n=1 Tax=Nerophis lumbriciformis TaxID=546530 RepID=UPI002AE04EC1|nr:regulator of G-protein signaling 12-like isoform X1 [Nerophis lumbriciformis]XP_061844185.1 regulator of G-protein signaling 12-like isoform X1 [Nerophis lumbriciformis]
MFKQVDSLPKRRPHGGNEPSRSQSPPPPCAQQRRLRAVEVARGRTGYGFTLSGQNPCVLSCVLKGSPADFVGLHSGDHVLTVNDINVSKASHEDVVKLIGRCTGVLKLVIGEAERHRRHHHQQRSSGSRHHSSNTMAAPYQDSCSSDDELDGLYHNSVNNNNNSTRAGCGPHGAWFKPKLDSKQLGINRAERVVAELQSGGIFNMIFENSSHSSSSSDKDRPTHNSLSKPRPSSDPEFPAHRSSSRSHSNPVMLSEEEMAQVLNDDSVFVDADFQHLHLHHQEEQDMDVGDGRDLVLEPSQDIVNVGMMVGYLGSIELASTGTSLESDSLQAIRGCMRRLRAEQKIHSLVLMKVLHDSVRLCSDRGQTLATYPAEKLAFSACCPDDRRFFGLVTMQATDDGHFVRGRYDEGGLRTSCHVFIVDPDLCHHQVHLGIARRFGFECTPDPDTGGCLEFPSSSQPLLHFVSVLYRDMGDNIEGVRARAFHDPDNDAQQNHSTSSNSDSGIGNFLPEEKSNRVLLVDLGGSANHNHVSGPRHWDSPPSSQQAWSPTLGVAASHPPPPPPAIRNGHYRHEPYLADLPHPLPLAYPDVPARHVRGAHPNHYSQGKWGGAVGGGDKRGAGGGAEPQRWLPVHVLRDWHQQHHQLQGLSSDQESYAESTDGWSSANCSTLPPPMSKIPADRYRAPLVPGEHLPPPGGSQPVPPLQAQTHTQRLVAQKDEWAKKLFGAGDRERSGNEKKQGGAKDAEKKGGRFRGLTMGFAPLPQRSSARRSFGRSKRLSMARSLDNLESTAVSDGELNNVELQGCSSDNSLNSNASLPSVQSHRRHTERRVASWAVCFERLLQDPVGVRYFSEFLKKEFSEENILFWQACEFFSHVPENDKKQLSQRAREIYNSFLSSKATTPVNIDSQAQLADDILNAPRPNMFKEQQLQIFNLMKFDSYTRFLKSLLYQECMLAEVEGRPLPDPYHIPSSPTSKHSTTGSDRSNLSTPKKEDKRSKSGRSLNDDSRDDSGDRRKGMFFSWSRNRSFGKGPKKRELTDFNYNFAGSNGRRESQGSLSSGASLELGTSGSGKNEGDVSRVGVSERGGSSAPLRQCNINLPDGSCCSVPLRAGVSIRDLLLGLCEKLCINLAAIDLFLVGGEKPLVLDQDCMTLCSRDLRLEKRTLFRLDLVPINRSVGLKAKPTKPVTEVLRPVVAKYGLHLSDLVARISGESEPLDLGLPISNLDGLRVVLDSADHTSGKAPSKSHTQASTSRNQSTTGEDRQSRKATSAHPHGENGKAGPSLAASSGPLPNHSVSLHKAPEKRKQKKINIDEAEEFFDLISKAQSNRADDQRGLLNKSDLQLPDFLRLSPAATGQPPYDPEPGCSTPHSRNSGNGSFPGGRLGNKANYNDRGGGGHFLNASHQSQSLDSALGSDMGGWGDARSPSSMFPATISPIHPSREAQHGAFKDAGRGASVQMLEEDALSDLTLVGEADLNSPSLNYVTPSALPSKPHTRPQQQAQDGQPSSGKDRDRWRGRERRDRVKVVSRTASNPAPPPPSPPPAPPRPPLRSRRKSKSPSSRSNRRLTKQALDVDKVQSSGSRDPRGSERDKKWEDVASELRCRGSRMRSAVYQTSDLPSMVKAKRQLEENGGKGHTERSKLKATFV